MLVLKFVIAILLFCIIIIFHELGHFILAKKNGIKVNEFSIGLGPTIIGFTKGETKYSIKLLPFGGACMMEGEDEESSSNRSFNSKTPLQRISVVAAGPIFNFLMALVFSIVLIGCHGHTEPVINSVTEGYSAEAAGLQSGDEIIKMGNKQIHFFEEVSGYIMFHTGEDIDIVYERDGERYETVLEPIYDQDSGKYLIGITGESSYVREGPLETVKYGFYETEYWIWATMNSLKMLVTGQVGLNDMSGPVGIVAMVADTYEQSMAEGIYYVFINMLNIAILLSANLGVMNLLPIPALDGGRLVFLVIEMIRGKRVEPSREGLVHFIGMMCLFGFMAIIMASDIVKLFVK